MPPIGNVLPSDLSRANGLWGLWNSESYIIMREWMLIGGLESACMSDGESSCPFRCASPVSNPGYKGGGFDTAIQRGNEEAVRESFARGEAIVSHYPVEMELRLGTLCNLNCEMCTQIPWRGREASLPSGLFDENFYEFVRHARQLTLTGGEPTMSPLFPTILDIIGEARGAKLFLITNGHRLCEAVLDSGGEECFSLINVSLDAGDEETYRVVRRNGNWPFVTDQITDFMRRKPYHIHLFISCVVSGMNFRDLGSVVRKANEMGVNHVVFSEVHSLESVMSGKTLDRWRGHLSEPSVLERALNDAISIGHGLGMRVGYTIPSISRFG